MDMGNGSIMFAMESQAPTARHGMPGIIVRAGGLSAEDYCRIAEAVGWEPRTLRDARDLVLRARHTVSAADSGAAIQFPVGMGRVIGDGARYFYIADIAVLPDFQGQGVGRMILEYLMALIWRAASDRGEVALNAAPGTEGFYAQFGFERVDASDLMCQRIIDNPRAPRRHFQA